MSAASPPAGRSVTDGVVTIRPPAPGDAEVLVAGRDDVFHRWMGPGSADPNPTACVVANGQVVGWVDAETGHDWLAAGEANLGYALFPAARGRGYATRAVQLLMHHLALSAEYDTASVLIDPGNDASLGVAARAGFVPVGEVEEQRYFKRPVPPLSYTDGIVTIRRQEVTDLGADLEAKDEEQIRWMWLPGHREAWEAMSPGQQRLHAGKGLQANHEAFGRGPKWTFAVDTAEVHYVAYVDCDLANGKVPHGEANISYSAHPAFRGRGYVKRAVLLVLQFLQGHTGAREAHILVDVENQASLRVARSVGAVETERRLDSQGRTLLRHVFDLCPVARGRDL